MCSQKNTLIDYYDTCEGDYRTFWDLDQSMSMHAGFWDATTKSLPEALARENEILAEYAHITSLDTILDAGCGVGGSSIFLSKKYGCRSIGITLSAKQVENATANAQKSNVASLASFKVMDFCDTEFPGASFDVVWAIESVCHASDKRRFIREAFRLLKPGGRLIVADGFATTDLQNAKEKYAMNKWLNGWGVASIETSDRFYSYLQSNDFCDIDCHDMTSYVLPSSRRLYYISLPAIVVSTMGEWIGIRKKIQTDNIKSAYYQYKTIQKGLWLYKVFVACKSGRF